ncbi:MAG: DUF6503 family protein [Planctomycetota bacterium]
MNAAAAVVMTFAAMFVGKVETAHQTEAYYAAAAWRADLAVEFPGAFELNGRMTFTPSMDKARMDLSDGTTVVWDGADCWVSPPEAANPMMRFHVLTWPYFMALPHKLDDPGTTLEDAGEVVVAPDTPYPAAKLTFGEGVGDAPDDWYYVLADHAGVVQASVYIVTYAADADEAAKTPSIIHYRDYVPAAGGVPVSRTWVFGYWDAEQGLTEEKGSAKLINVATVEPGEGFFAKPEGAVAVAAP